MKPSDYRREYAAYCSALESERYNLHAGLSSRPGFAEIDDRYADLRTLEAIEDLRRASDETPSDFETERAALRALLGAARLRYMEAGATEIVEELAACESSARIDRNGERVAAADVPDLIAVENDASRRRELSARWFDALGACDDLRAARLETLEAAAVSLGFGGSRALRESFTGINTEKTAAASDGFLERTAPLYTVQLAQWAARQSPPLVMDELRYADALFFERAARLEQHFPSANFQTLYVETMAGLGIKAGTQRNLRLDTEARPAKKTHSACFGINPPADVRLVLGASRGGAKWYQTTFQEAARAQYFVWSSRDLAGRYPEFIHPPDGATCDGYGFLFSGLLRDVAWLESQGRRRATQAREVSRSTALVELYEVRRECAALRYSLALDEMKDVRSEQSAERYLMLYDEATGFRHAGATRLLDAGRASHAQQSLRARLFAAGLREHLRTRYGTRWYASREAGGELIDLWNTASRYTVEELARLVWGGELDFELSANELIAAVVA